MYCSVRHLIIVCTVAGFICACPSERSYAFQRPFEERRFHYVYSPATYDWFRGDAFTFSFSYASQSIVKINDARHPTPMYNEDDLHAESIILAKQALNQLRVLHELQAMKEFHELLTDPGLIPFALSTGPLSPSVENKYDAALTALVKSLEQRTEWLTAQSKAKLAEFVLLHDVGAYAEKRSEQLGKDGSTDWILKNERQGLYISKDFPKESTDSIVSRFGGHGLITEGSFQIFDSTYEYPPEVFNISRAKQAFSFFADKPVLSDHTGLENAQIRTDTYLLPKAASYREVFQPLLTTYSFPLYFSATHYYPAWGITDVASAVTLDIAVLDIAAGGVGSFIRQLPMLFPMHSLSDNTAAETLPYPYDFFGSYLIRRTASVDVQAFSALPRWAAAVAVQEQLTTSKRELEDLLDHWIREWQTDVSVEARKQRTRAANEQSSEFMKKLKEARERVDNFNTDNPGREP